MISEEVKGSIDGLTDIDIKNDIEVGIYSCYGGMYLHSIKLSQIDEWLTRCERRLNRDFIISKF